MAHTLPELTYDYNQLEPHIDAKTMEIHHTKHHQTYINNLNIALENYPELFDKTVEDLLINLENIPESIRGAVRNGEEDMQIILFSGRQLVQILAVLHQVKYFLK